jgi:hypothetical protein
MDTAVPTIRVKHKKSGLECVINQTDFDESIWQPVEKEKVADAKKAKAEAAAQEAAAAEEARKQEDIAKSKQAKRGVKAGT